MWSSQVSGSSEQIRRGAVLATVLALLAAGLLTASPVRGQQNESVRVASMGTIDPLVGVDQSIANGLETFAFPTTAALVDIDSGQQICTATLTGCGTVVTAAHCLCDTDGRDCSRGSGVAPAARLGVFLSNSGMHRVRSVAIHPEYVFGARSDVAVLELLDPVQGIEPTALHRGSQPTAGTKASIVGFGISSEQRGDSGIKRSGRVELQTCRGVDADEHLCWRYTGPTAAAGRVSNTCPGDSGGPLFLDAPGGRLTLAGVTSGGSGPCDTDDEAFDADIVANLNWIDQQTGSGRQCRGLPTVGSKDVAVLGASGRVSGSQRSQTHAFDVAPGTDVLRVTLAAEEVARGAFTEVDLIVREGDQVRCRSDRSGVFEACEVDRPAAGKWSAQVVRRAGNARYQVSTTMFGGEQQPVSTERCSPSATELCLSGEGTDQRFAVQLAVDTELGGGFRGPATARPLAGIGVETGGLFWFFDSANPEVLVKVLNACSINNHFWVFGAAATNLGFELTVRDTETGLERRYANADGEDARAISDTAAFPCS